MSAPAINNQNKENNVKEFYAHDLVYKFDERNRIRFGVVSVSYEGSDSSDQLSTLQKGQVLVIWDNELRKQICKQSKIHLMSRCVIPGDIVRRLQDGKETQRGYCKSIKQYATVQIIETDKVIEHVSDSRLCLVKPFDIGDAVSLGEKFGRIQEMDEIIRMRSKCGSIVEIKSNDNFHIKDYWSHLINGGQLEPCYPSQTVICKPMQLNNPKWIKKSKVMKRRMEIAYTFTIESIQTVLIEVWWHSSGAVELSDLEEDKIKKMKVIKCSDYLGVWTRNLLKIKPTDVVMKKRDWLKKKSKQYLISDDKVTNDAKNDPAGNKFDDDWITDTDEDDDDQNDKELTGLLTSHLAKMKSAKKKKQNARKAPKFGSGSIVPCDVLCTESRATIVWQDGSEEADVPTTELYYSVSLDDHEFFPGECVVHNNNESPDTYGVVQRVNFLERTAEVKWFSVKSDEQPEEVRSNEMSVYDLKKHMKYVFRPGSVVKAKPIQADKMGNVIDSCPQGYVIVQWLDGVVENVWPHKIELIPETEDFSFVDDFDSCSDAYSWETESVESFYGDVTDEITLQNMASKVNFIRNRINYLREAFNQHNINKNFYFVKDLLCIYDNSSYLDKYLGTSFFSLESKHFQALLAETRKKGKLLGIDLRDLMSGYNKPKNAEKENIQKMINLETKVNAQIESITKETTQGEACTPESDPGEKVEENLCVELLYMLKMRMDLAYAEIVSRIGGRQALTVLTSSSTACENSMKLTSSAIALHDLASPLLTPDDSLDKPVEFPESGAKGEAFAVIDEAPDSHHFYGSKFEPVDMQKFLGTLQREYKLLRESLPAGVWVRAYGDRMHLLSVMIRGPAKTPYEDGLFLFDMELCPYYPRNPPLVHYISYSSEALNPNLYVEGKVCVSLLGTWMGKDNEVWGPNSTLLQIIVSIQGLILVAEPYYNEAGYERQNHTQQGYENSRTYNEFVLLKLVQSMGELLKAPPKVFRCEILEHFKVNGERMCERLLKYCSEEEPLKPDFSLLPVSKGLKLSLKGALDAFRWELKKVVVCEEGSSGGDVEEVVNC